MDPANHKVKKFDGEFAMLLQ